MLSTDLKKESMIQRIGKIVTLLMEERPLFKEEVNYSEMVEHLAKLFEENLSFEEFNTMSDIELKKHCSGMISLYLLANAGEQFTPEQMAIFDEAIKRK